MKKHLIRTITDYILDNKRQYAVVICALLMGVILGSVSAASVSGEQYENLDNYMESFVSSYNLQSISKLGVFLSSVATNLKTVFFLWISGMWVGLIPFTIFQIGVKGYKMGFSVSFLISVYKGRGILFAITTLMPQIMLFLPALTVYAVFSIKYAFAMKKIRSRNGGTDMVRRDMYFRNFLCTAALVLIMLICSLFDAYVIPTMLKPICSYIAA